MHMRIRSVVVLLQTVFFVDTRDIAVTYLNIELAIKQFISLPTILEFLHK